VLPLLLALAALASVRPCQAEEFDKLVAVGRGTRLDVRLFGGEVTVRGWSRDEVRVHATHFRTDAIEVRPAEGSLTVRARSQQGPPHAIDLAIDVPVWMPVKIVGTYVDVSISGTKAAITAETARGDLRVQGGVGAITLKSVEGEVVLQGAEGKAELHAVNDGVRVTGFRGDLLIDTVNGSVKLEGTHCSSITVGTVGGDVSWDGPIADGGRYQFATHYGDIDVQAARSENVTVAVRAFDGQFRSRLPAPTVPAASGRQRRVRFVLGSGSAHLDLETFRGVISLREGR
jgi:DUF4097 and DUF4098 domain-containing protein YvlB